MSQNPADDLCNELDLLVEHSRSTNLSPEMLLDMQAQISGIRYTLCTYMTRAEGAHLAAKDRRDLHVVKQKLSLQAKDPKLSSTKAEDMVLDRSDTEVMYQEVIRTKIDFAGIKNRIDTSNDVLVSIAQRIKRLENQMVESRMQRQAR